MAETIGSVTALGFRDTLSRGIKVESKSEAIFARPITFLEVPFFSPVLNRLRPA